MHADDTYADSPDTGTLTLTRYSQLADDVDILTTEETATKTDLWSALMDPWRHGVPRHFAEALRRLYDEEGLAGIYDYAPTGDGLFATVAVSLVTSTPAHREFWVALDAARQFGRGKPLMLTTSTEDIDAALRVLVQYGDLSGDDGVEITAALGQQFGDKRPSIRSGVLGVLDRLRVSGADLRLVASPTVRRLLSMDHRDDLPGVNDADDSRRREGPLGEVVDEARANYTPDSVETRVMKILYDTSGGIATDDDLQREIGVTRGRISQVINGRSADSKGLAGRGLVERVTVNGSTGVEILPAGKAYVEKVREIDGEQSRFDRWASISESESDESSGRSHPDRSREDHPAGPDQPPAAAGDADVTPTGGSDERGRSHPDFSRSEEPPEVADEGETVTDSMGREYSIGGLYSVNPLPVTDFDRAVGISESADVTIVDGDIENRGKDRYSPRVRIDESTDTIVSSSEPWRPKTLIASDALNLTSSAVLDYALSLERLDQLDDDRLKAYFDDHRPMLRDARCIGWLDDDASFEDFIARLREQHQNIWDMLQDLGNDEYVEDDRPDGETWNEACLDVIRLSHGVAGTMAHLLDLAGVDLVREVRLPHAKGGLNGASKEEPRRQLLRTLMLQTIISSRYGEIAGYRQQCERRPSLREKAITPTVDAADPFGTIIGSWVIIGDFGEQGSPMDDYAETLRRLLDNPEMIHEDASEFNIPVEIAVEGAREAYRGVVEQVADRKGLSVTPEAISLLHGLTRSPHDAVTALDALAKERMAEAIGRDIRADEVRYALSTLDSSRLLRGGKPGARDLLQALLRNPRDFPTKKALAEAADVTPATVRNHLPALVASGLVEDDTDTGGGIRLALTPPRAMTDGGEGDSDTGTPEERYPKFVRGGGERPERHLAAKSLKLARAYYDDTVDDPDDSEFKPQYLDLRGLAPPGSGVDPWAWVADILPALWGLSETMYAEELTTEPPRMTAYVGPEVEQAAITDAVEEAGAA